MNKSESLCAIEDAWKEFERCGEISNSAENVIKAAEYGWKDHDALVEALESMLDAHGEGDCRYVRGCCQEHFDLTGDGSCYTGKAKEVLKNAKR